jgi:ribosomal protein S14
VRGVCEQEGRHQSYEAETVKETARVVYVNLRCIECGRIRGVRRVVIKVEDA